MKQTVCRCTRRKSVPEGKVGGDESKGCWRRYRKAYATKGKGKRSNYVTNIYCCISHHLDKQRQQGVLLDVKMYLI